MADEVLTIPEETQVAWLEPTVGLRWFRPAGGGDAVLQQCWISSHRGKFWEDVPVEAEDEGG